LDAVVCQDAQDFPADLIFQKKPKRAGVPRSFSLPGGVSTLADGLAATPGLRCITGARITHIERFVDQFEVRGDALALHCRHIALAVPPDQAALLLAKIHPALAAQLSHIEVARVESLGIITRNKGPELPLIAGLIGQQQLFYSVVSRDTLLDSAHRGFTFHFRPGKLDEAEKLALAARVIGVRQKDFDEVVFTTHTLPSPRLGHAERVQRIDKALTDLPITLTGNYFSGLSIEATVMRSHSQWLRLQSL
jgi:protoporphyrinogen oxidase